MNTKKGVIAAEKMVFYLLYAVIVSAVFIGFIIVVSSEVADKSNIPEGLEDYIFSRRFLDSCFVYEDDVRTYPGIIDFNKFNQGNLDICYNTDSNNVKAFRLTLEIREENTKKEIQTKNWEGSVKRHFTKNVLVYYNNKINNGELKIEVQNPR